MTGGANGSASTAADSSRAASIRPKLLAQATLDLFTAEPIARALIRSIVAARVPYPEEVPVTDGTSYKVTLRQRALTLCAKAHSPSEATPAATTAELIELLNAIRADPVSAQLRSAAYKVLNDYAMPPMPAYNYVAISFPSWRAPVTSELALDVQEALGEALSNDAPFVQLQYRNDPIMRDEPERALRYLASYEDCSVRPRCRDLLAGRVTPTWLIQVAVEKNLSPTGGLSVVIRLTDFRTGRERAALTAHAGADTEAFRQELPPQLDAIRAELRRDLQEPGVPSR